MSNSEYLEYKVEVSWITEVPAYSKTQVLESMGKALSFCEGQIQ